MDARCNVTRPNTWRELLRSGNCTNEVQRKSGRGGRIEVLTVAHKPSKSASDDLVDRLCNPTSNRKSAEVCGVRHMCFWEQER